MHAHATIKAPAKVNLYLDILGVRPDGYHELLTLFHHLHEPFDTLEIASGKKGAGLVLSCSIPGLDPEDNLVHRAWSVFGGATGWFADIEVGLEKRIPTGAGLGGGSSDAAAMLRHLNSRIGEETGKDSLSSEAMNELAAGLGSDVAFFLLDGPAWARGRGERLVPTKVDLSGMILVLVCPNAHVSTPWAYREWDRLNPDKASTGFSAGAGAFLTRAEAESMKFDFPSGLILYNAFEDVVFGAFPGLREIKERLLRAGAFAAAMSGSGASVFGLFRERDVAMDAASLFRKTGAAAHVNVF